VEGAMIAKQELFDLATDFGLAPDDVKKDSPMNSGTMVQKLSNNCNALPNEGMSSCAGFAG